MMVEEKKNVWSSCGPADSNDENEVDKYYAQENLEKLDMALILG